MPLVGIGTLTAPFSPASVPLPPETGGRGHTSLRVGGWGESQFRRRAYTVVLFICTYFVVQYFAFKGAHFRRNVATSHIIDMVWLYCLPVPVRRERVFYMPGWLLPAFAEGKRGDSSLYCRAAARVYCTLYSTPCPILYVHCDPCAGVRPYKCNLCEKSFTQRCSLESHCLKVHGVAHQYEYKQRRSKVLIYVLKNP